MTNGNGGMPACAAGKMGILPWRVRNFIRRIASAMAMPVALRWVKHSPSHASVSLLRFAWNNDSFSADVDYLLAVANAASRAPGPILECGSGITTLLLGLIAQRRGIRVYSLEHEARWQLMAQHMLDRCNVHSAEVFHTPLRSSNAYDWYTVPPDLPQFDLVICDGPPGDTRGGRFGLLPEMRSRLAGKCTILFDDSDRPDERKILERWLQDFGAVYFLQKGKVGEFAIVRFK